MEEIKQEKDKKNSTRRKILNIIRLKGSFLKPISISIIREELVKEAINICDVMLYKHLKNLFNNNLIHYVYATYEEKRPQRHYYII